MAVNPLALNACALFFWCNSMDCSGTSLGLGRRTSPDAGAIPCHTGKALQGLSPACAAWRGTNHWEGTGVCSSVGCSFPCSLGQTSSTFLGFHCALRRGRGGELLLRDRLGSEEVGMSWQFVCTSHYMELGVGLSSGRYRQACRGSR